MNPLFLNNILITTVQKDRFNTLIEKCKDRFNITIASSAWELVSSISNNNCYDLYLVCDDTKSLPSMIERIEAVDPFAVIYGYAPADYKFQETPHLNQNCICSEQDDEKVLEHLNQIINQLNQQEEERIRNFNEDEKGQFIAQLHKKSSKKRGSLFEFPLLVVDAETSEFCVADKFGRHKEAFLNFRDKLLEENEYSEIDLALRLWRAFIFKRDNFARRPLILFYIDLEDPFLFNNPYLLDDDDELEEESRRVDELQQRYMQNLKKTFHFWRQFNHFILLDIHGNLFERPNP